MRFQCTEMGSLFSNKQVFSPQQLSMMGARKCSNSPAIIQERRCTGDDMVRAACFANSCTGLAAVTAGDDWARARLTPRDPPEGEDRAARAGLQRLRKALEVAGLEDTSFCVTTARGQTQRINPTDCKVLPQHATLSPRLMQ